MLSYLAVLPGCPVLVVLFYSTVSFLSWLSCSGFLSRLSFPASFFLTSCPVCFVLAFLSWLLCSFCNVLLAPFPMYWPGCPVLAVLSGLSCSGCLLLVSCPGYPVLVYLSGGGGPVPSCTVQVVLYSLPVLPVLFLMFCSRCSVLSIFLQ